MSKLKDKKYKRFGDIKHIRNNGSEFWSAENLLQYWSTINGKICKRYKTYRSESLTVN